VIFLNDFYIETMSRSWRNTIYLYG